jgi:hypothetical protein
MNNAEDFGREVDFLSNNHIEQLKKLLYCAEYYHFSLSLGEPNEVNQKEMNITADYIRQLHAELKQLEDETN